MFFKKSISAIVQKIGGTIIGIKANRDPDGFQRLRRILKVHKLSMVKHCVGANVTREENMGPRARHDDNTKATLGAGAGATPATLGVPATIVAMGVGANAGVTQAQVDASRVIHD